MSIPQRVTGDQLEMSHCYLLRRVDGQLGPVYLEDVLEQGEPNVKVGGLPETTTVAYCKGWKERWNHWILDLRDKLKPVVASFDYWAWRLT
jgi:hypothetical protein